jgi:hypothetical protein
LAAWKLTIRDGSDVSRQGFDDLDAAIDAAEAATDAVLAEGPASRVKAIRDYEPEELVNARIEIAGKGFLSPPTAGLDVQGDGTLIGFSGGITRKRFPTESRDEIFAAIRGVLSDG